MFGHTSAPTPVSAHAHPLPHTHVCCPTPATGQVTDLLPPWAISLTLSPSCRPPQNHSAALCPVVLHLMPKPHARCAGNMLCQRALPRELSLGGCMSVVVCALVQPPRSPHIVRDVSEGSESRSKSSTSPVPNPHPESQLTGTGIRTGTHHGHGGLSPTNSPGNGSRG